MTLLTLAEEPSSWPANRRQAQQAQKLTAAERSRRVLGRPLASWLGVGCRRREPVGSLSWHRRALLVFTNQVGNASLAASNSTCAILRRPGLHGPLKQTYSRASLA